MHARFQKLSVDPGRSFRVLDLRLSRFDAPWHFHPEVELTLIVESRGRRFVGDSVESFEEGDLVLLGPNLPHFWHNEGREPGGRRSRAVVVQFLPNFLGEESWNAPEFAAVHRMIERAARGLHFTGAPARTAAERLRALPAQRGLAGLIALLSILDLLASARSTRPLASSAFAPRLDARSGLRMARVYEFLMQHYAEPLTLPQIARVAAMTAVAFSRYFKRTAGRNISDFLNDLRISHAAQRLRETTCSITQIAADVGYPTVSNFNRRFRERFGCPPRVYRRDSTCGAGVTPG